MFRFDEKIYYSYCGKIYKHDSILFGKRIIIFEKEYYSYFMPVKAIKHINDTVIFKFEEIL